MRVKRSVLVFLGILFLGSLLTIGWLISAQSPFVNAQGSINLDGLGDDWDSYTGAKFEEVDNPLLPVSGAICGTDELTMTLDHPHDHPCYARTGYDVTALSGLYQASDDAWYFRMDLDGVPGDSDSRPGKPPMMGTLGFGTSGHDGGWLLEEGVDPDGLDADEKYELYFHSDRDLIRVDGRFVRLSGIQDPVEPIELSRIPGQAFYVTTLNPNQDDTIIEWRIRRQDLFPPGTEQSRLYVGAYADSDWDRMGEDSIVSDLVLGIDVDTVCPEPVTRIGQVLTFPIEYSIDPASSYPIASDVVITANVPQDTIFDSCSDACSVSGRVITWNLGDLSQGTGQVSFSAALDTDAGITVRASMSIAEGLRAEASDSGCPGLQPPPPTATPPPPPPPPPPTQPPPTSPPPTATPPFILPPSGQATSNLPGSGWLWLLASVTLLGIGWGVTRRRR